MKLDTAITTETLEVLKDYRMAIWLLPPVVVILFLLIALRVVIGPKLVEVRAFQGKEKQLRGEIKTVEEKRRYIEVLKSSDLGGEEALVDSCLLREKDAYWLVNLLKILADKHLFSLQSFSISPGLLTNSGGQEKIKESGLTGVSAKVSFVGSKDKYIEFLLNVERVLPVLSIDKLEIRSSGETVAELEMVVSAYYQQEIPEKDLRQLSLADFKVGPEELAALEKLAGFESLAQVRSSIGGLMGGKQGFVEYNRGDPFSF